MAEWRIRPLEIHDLGDLEKMEQQQFRDPYTTAIWRRELSNSLAHTYVAVENHGPESDEIIGYINFWTIIDEAELHRLAVKEECRRYGVACGLLNFMFRMLRRMSIGSVHLEVRCGNIPAIKCYEKYGFIMKGRRPGYYGESGEDAFILEASVARRDGSDNEEYDEECMVR